MDRFFSHSLKIVISIMMIFLNSGFSGQVENLTTMELNDDSPPMVSLGMSGPTGKNGWYNQPVTVVVKAFDDGSGIVSRQVSVGGTIWYENALVLRKDGTYRIYGRAVDRAGNMSTTSTLVNIDMTKPELKLSVPDPKGYKKWHVNPVQVKLSGSDGLSGMAETNLLIEGSSISSEISPWESQEAFNLEKLRSYQQIISGKRTGVSNSQALIEESGNYKITGFVEDLAGNRTYIEKTLEIDLTMPEVEIRSPKKFFGKITIEGSVLDFDSGISKLMVDLGNGWKEVKVAEDGGWQVVWHTDELRDGKYLVQSKVSDVAGNQSFAYYTATVLNNIWPIFAIFGVLVSLGVVAAYDPRRSAWSEFSTTLVKIARMEKNSMKLRREMR